MGQMMQEDSIKEARLYKVSFAIHLWLDYYGVQYY